VTGPLRDLAGYMVVLHVFPDPVVRVEVVNIQVPGLGVAASNRGLRSSVGRGVAVAG
jgi:hypothetical protein